VKIVTVIVFSLALMLGASPIHAQNPETDTETAEADRPAAETRSALDELALGADSGRADDEFSYYTAFPIGSHPEPKNRPPRAATRGLCTWATASCQSLSPCPPDPNDPCTYCAVDIIQCNPTYCMGNECV